MDKNKRNKSFKGHELFYFATCPYCIKVRITMRMMGLKLPMRNIHTNPEYRSALIAGGGKKQVPCLRIEDDQGGVQWMYESSDIVRYMRQRLSA